MLDRQDTTYFNLQGSMIYDPAINEDVPLVEVPILAFTEYWQNLLKLNSTFLDYIRGQHAEAGYTSFYEEHFNFPPNGVFPSANNSADFSSRIRGLIQDAMTLQEPCFNVYHITDTCPTLWSWNAEDAFPLAPFTQAGIQDPQLNTGDSGPYYNLTVVRDAIHAPVGREWEACSPNPVFTNPSNATSGDGSPRAQLTVMPGVFDRTPGINIVANGQFDMLIPSNGTLFSLQNVTWRGAQGFSEYPPNILQIPPSGINASDENGPWGSFAKIEGVGRSGEMGKWVFERGVGFVDVAYAGHGVGRYNAAAMFRIIEVLLGRVGVEEGFGGAAWSVDIAASGL
ncbi:putative carboxypeptidase cpds [Diaporthe ampelina]|uniref:Putative carboxypeptidase cpds n=1 Tax=Diaporthe ampelina TaxID=1214573 RepID=A0A0G2HEF0_9PEZI|nr:putative carboxypeptidase cpds [Diaporthe ampelina]